MLQQKGVYVYTTNEIFFNDIDLTNPRNVRGILRDSGLDILYKATQYTHVLQRNGHWVVTEDCGILSARQGDYDCLPNFGKAIETVRQRLDRYKDSFQYTEGYGTLDQLQEAIVNGQTNIAVVKTASDKYHWFNIQGVYSEVFPELAQIGDGFYPDLF